MHQPTVSRLSTSKCVVLPGAGHKQERQSACTHNKDKLPNFFPRTPSVTAAKKGEKRGEEKQNNWEGGTAPKSSFSTLFKIEKLLGKGQIREGDGFVTS